MLTPLLIGSVMILVNLVIQVIGVTWLIRYFVKRAGSGQFAPSFGNDFRILTLVVTVITVGHYLQFTTWATLFFFLGEFQDFSTAFYHSTVNFTSLGYGDIVMSERWRLLGGLEAANGVIMFGLSAGTVLSTMSILFGRHQKLSELKNNMQNTD